LDRGSLLRFFRRPNFWDTTHSTHESRRSLQTGILLDFGGTGQYPVHVKSITYTAARENLASTINRVCEDQAPVMITRNRDQAVVMLSLSEYESLQETAYLLRSPANAKRLLKSIDSLERGKRIRKKLKLDM